MDMNVLMSAQLLMEQVAAEGSGPLLYLLYQHLLFNFHLWTLRRMSWAVVGADERRCPW